MKSKVFSLLCCFYIVSNTSAQGDEYIKGYLIKGQDTLRGYINNSKDPWNSKEFIFRKSLKDKNKMKISTKDVPGFYFQASDEHFTRRIADIDKSATEVMELVDDQKMIIKRDTVYLQLLIGGELNLYTYVDFKRHFFIEMHGGLTELLLLKYVSTEEQLRKVFTKEKYKDQLKKILNKCDSFPKINFSAASLTQSVKISNLCSSNLTYVQKKEKPKLSFGILGGVGTSSLSYLGAANGDLALNKYRAALRTFNTQQNLSFGGFVDVFLKNRNSFSFNGELIFRPTNSFYASNNITYPYDTRMDYTIHVKYSSLNLGVKYRLLRAGGFNLSMKVNFSLPIISNIETYQIQTYNGTQKRIDALANFNKLGYGYALGIQGSFKSFFLQIRLDNVSIPTSQATFAKMAITTSSIFAGIKIK